MGPKRFWSQNFSLYVVRFKKLGFSAPFKGATRGEWTPPPLSQVKV